MGIGFYVFLFLFLLYCVICKHHLDDYGQGRNLENVSQLWRSTLPALGSSRTAGVEVIGNDTAAKETAVTARGSGQLAAASPS